MITRSIRSSLTTPGNVISPAQVTELCQLLYELGIRSQAQMRVIDFTTTTRNKGGDVAHPVTSIDLYNHRALERGLRRLFGDTLQIIGEEDRAGGRTVFSRDTLCVSHEAIDGTIQIAAGLDSWSIMMTFILNGEAVLTLVLQSISMRVLVGGLLVGGIYEWDAGTGYHPVVPATNFKKIGVNDLGWGAYRDPFMLPFFVRLMNRYGYAGSIPCGHMTALMIRGHILYSVNYAASAWDVLPAAALLPLIGGAVGYVDRRPIDWLTQTGKILAPIVFADSPVVLEEIQEKWEAMRTEAGLPVMFKR